MNRSTQLLLFTLALATFSVPLAFCEPVPIGNGQVIQNQIVNRDFESGPNWGGGTTAPEGWVNTVTSPSAYIDPASGPLSGARSLVTWGQGDGARGQITSQTGLHIGPRWQLRFDVALEDPPLGRDQLSMYMIIPDVNGNPYLVMWLRDDAPDDDVLDVYFRTPAVTKVGDVPGFVFSGEGSATGAPSGDNTLFTAPVVHRIILDGHFEVSSPFFNMTIQSAGGSTLAYFGGLQTWHRPSTNAPAQGAVVTGVRFVGDSFSTGRAQIDNIAFGSVETAGAPGFVLVDGQKTIPLGWQAIQPHSQGERYSRLQLNECREHRYDCLMTYNAMQFGSDFQMLMHLDQAHARGVKVMVDLSGGTVEIPEIVRRANVVKDHPALYGYYLSDEPDLRATVTPADLIAGYGALRAADPDPAHPVLVSFHHRLGDVRDYLPGTEIAMRELFSLNGIFDPTANLQVPSDLAVAREHGLIGYVGIPRAFQGAGLMPSLDQFKYNALAPISMGAGGIIHHIFETFVPPDTLAIDPDWRHTVAYPVTDLLASVRPILLGHTEMISATSTNAAAGSVTFVFGGDTNNAVLIAAHNAASTVSGIDFDLAGMDPSIAHGTVLTEGRSVSLVGGSFQDSFGPWAVHVYRFATTTLPDGGSRAVTVSGAVDLQGFPPGPAGVTVVMEIRDPGQPVVRERHDVALAANGAYTFACETKGLVDIAAKASHWARQVQPNVDTTSDVMVDFSLANGDCDRDGVVRLSDGVLLEAALGSTPPATNWNAECDLNGDNMVSATDRTILQSNLVIPDLRDTLIVSADIGTDVQVYMLDRDSLAGLAGHSRGWFDRVSGITAVSDGNFALIHGGQHVTRVSLMSPYRFEDVNDTNVRITVTNNNTSGLGAGGMINRFDEIFAAEHHGNFSGGATYDGLDPALPFLVTKQAGFWDHMVQHNAGDTLSNGDFVLTIDISSFGGDTGVEWRRRSSLDLAQRVTSGFQDVRGLAVNRDDVIGVMDQTAGGSTATLFRRTTNPTAGTSSPAGSRSYAGQTCAAVDSLSDGTWSFAMNSTGGGNATIVLLDDTVSLAELDSVVLAGVSNINCLAVQSDDDILVGTQAGQVIRLDAALNVQASVDVFDPVRHVAVLQQGLSADADGDGLPDFWESLHFGGYTNGVAGADDDDDEALNIDEFTADTLPTSGASVFRIDDVSAPGPAVISFTSSGERLYTLQSAIDIAAGAWTNVPGLVDRTGVDGPDAFTNTTGKASPAYRIRVRLP